MNFQGITKIKRQVYQDGRTPGKIGYWFCNIYYFFSFEGGWMVESIKNRYVSFSILLENLCGLGDCRIVCICWIIWQTGHVLVWKFDWYRADVKEGWWWRAPGEIEYWFCCIIIIFFLKKIGSWIQWICFGFPILWENLCLGWGISGSFVLNWIIRQKGHVLVSKSLIGIVLLWIRVGGKEFDWYHVDVNEGWWWRRLFPRVVFGFCWDFGYSLQCIAAYCYIFECNLSFIKERRTKIMDTIVSLLHMIRICYWSDAEACIRG